MKRKISMVSMVLLAIISATSYYCIAQLPVSAAPSRVIWSAGSDAIAKIDANGQPEISLTIEPNVTNVYTDALKFTLLSQSDLSHVEIEIASVIDSDGIIWGIRFYVFKSGTSTSALALVDGGLVPIENTDGAAAVCAVGYRQSDACLGYGETTTPIDSKAFNAAGSAAYKVAVEVCGRDGILSGQAATLLLELVWS
jgi:hypothetical protein